MSVIDKSEVLKRLCAACSNNGSFACISCLILKIVQETPEIDALTVWIPCSERLPDELQNVIVCTNINTVTVAWINGEGWTFADTGGGHTESWSFDDVKYWMPLPEPPEVRDDDKR